MPNASSLRDNDPVNFCGLRTTYKDAKRIGKVVRKLEHYPPDRRRETRRPSKQHVVVPPRMIVRGTLDGPLLRGESATMSVLRGTADTGENVTVHDFMLKEGSAPLSAGTRVCAMLDMSSNRFYVTAAECA